MKKKSEEQKRQRYSDVAVLFADAMYKERYRDTKDSKEAWEFVAESLHMSSGEATRKLVRRRMRKMKS